MNEAPADIVAINTDGTAVASDGRVVQLMIGRQHMLGYRAVASGDAVAHDAETPFDIDQISKRVAPPSLSSLGLDQV